MFGRTGAPAQLTVSGEIYGVGLQLVASDKPTLRQMRDWLAPLFTERPEREGDFRLELNSFPDGSYELIQGDRLLADGDRDEVFDSFDRTTRHQVAFTAPDHLFFHAGVVAFSGRAIVIPGSSFSGKTTLTAALAAAGGLYYSDEYAVIDQEGRVHPYPKPLSLRLEAGSRRQTHRAPADFGAQLGTESASLGLVVVCQYRHDATWAPVELTPAEAVLELIANTFADMERMPALMQSLRKTFEATGATGLKGDRGDVAEIVPDLLGRLEALTG